MEISTTLLANSINSGILTTDKDLKIVGWNRWLEKHSGKPADDLLGQHLLNAYPDLVERALTATTGKLFKGRL